MAKWPPEDDAKLREMFLAGAPMYEIADALWRSVPAVVQRRQTLGLPARNSKEDHRKAQLNLPPKWSAPDMERLRELWDAGKPASEIAAEMKITKSAVVGKAHRMGLAGRPSPIITTGAKPAPKRAEKITLAPLAAVATSPASASVPVARAVTPPQVLAARPAKACQWLDGPGPYVPCSTSAVHGKPYCAAHCARAYTRKAEAV